MTDRPRALAVLIAVFLLGGIVGSGGSYLWFRNRLSSETRPMRDRDFTRGSLLGGRRLSDILQLTPEQNARFREIMDESFKEVAKLRTKQTPIFQQLEELRKEQEPQFEAIRNQTNKKLMGILNPEQQKKFSELLKNMENFRRRMPYGREGGRGMGGPMSPMGPPDRGPRPMEHPDGGSGPGPQRGSRDLRP